MKQTVSILLRKQEGGVVRLAGMLYRRGYEIEHLLVAPDRQANHMRVVATVCCDRFGPGQLLRQVGKLMDVVTAEVL
ncbi:ACT domain-containing protein [Acetonema longum]|uniref:Acetolactate synthase n=1 Tax=Acetonema longum DSM 6540 TaxID=1009370 RepID=F7NLI6_9FIRM|nr:ACT domain-containing protein [Acetonema longum]EGO63081.1 hypothetical protein ALO_14792 [Acetonema longum DSM 6540]